MTTTMDYLAETQPIRVRRKKEKPLNRLIARVFPAPQPYYGNIEMTQVIWRRKGGTPAEIRRRKLLSTYSFVTFYLVAITLAEALTTIFAPAAGVIGHAVLLTMIFIHAAFSRDLVRQRMLATFSLAPLIRIVSLAMPLQSFSFTLWYMLVGAPLLLSAFLVARYNGFHAADIGLRFSKNWLLQILIGCLGIFLGLLEYLILRPQPLASELTFEAIWMPALILLFFTGMLEEVIFRGLMQRTFFNALGRIPGLIYVSLIFAVLHLGYHSLLDLLFVFGVAVVFGLIAMRSRTIFGVTLAHGLTNICLFLIFPFLIG